MADLNVERIAAELAIRNVLARPGAVRRRRATREGYLARMTPDIVWAMPENPGLGLPASERHGHDEIAQRPARTASRPACRGRDRTRCTS